MSELWDIYDIHRTRTGRTIERGKTLADGEYHLVVQVWIHNKEGKWLISRRSPNKHMPLLWEPTGGSVLVGEDSLTGALRETKEELGVVLDPARGKLFTSLRRDRPEWPCPGFLDVWVFQSDTAIEDVIFQEGETCDAMWADKKTILAMIAEKSFIPMEHYGYLERLFTMYP